MNAPTNFSPEMQAAQQAEIGRHLMALGEGAYNEMTTDFLLVYMVVFASCGSWFEHAPYRRKRQNQTSKIGPDRTKARTSSTRSGRAQSAGKNDRSEQIWKRAQRLVDC